jgi:hypothetical protein
MPLFLHCFSPSLGKSVFMQPTHSRRCMSGNWPFSTSCLISQRGNNMGIFGWSYPPGCSSVPGDEPDPPCKICGHFPEDCVCPECPRCGETGSPECYQEPDLGICGELYGKKTPQQELGHAMFISADLYQQWQEAELYVDYLKSQIIEEEMAK